MKITIKKEIEETYELKLPAYRKNNVYFYKIINEEQAVQICVAKNSESIAMSYTTSALKLAPIESNEEEFDVKLNEIIELLKKKIG
jgi:hypothetical protein